MLNTIEDIFENITNEQKSCLSKLHECFIKVSDDFEEAFDNMYFETDEFEELIIKYAELIKFNRELYKHYDN